MGEDIPMPKTKLVIQKEYSKHITKTFRIPIEISDKLQTIADNHNTSVNRVVTQMLEFALDNLEEK